MHAGERPCGHFRCDDATEMQAEDLDASKGAARRDSAFLAGAGVHVTGNCLYQWMLTTMRNRTLLCIPFLPITMRQPESGLKFCGVERQPLRPTG